MKYFAHFSPFQGCAVQAIRACQRAEAEESEREPKCTLRGDICMCQV